MAIHNVIWAVHIRSKMRLEFKISYKDKSTRVFYLPIIPIDCIECRVETRSEIANMPHPSERSINFRVRRTKAKHTE